MLSKFKLAINPATLEFHCILDFLVSPRQLKLLVCWQCCLTVWGRYAKSHFAKICAITQ